MKECTIRNVSEFLEKSAKLYPDKVALADANQSITFLKLKKKAHAIASQMIQSKVRRKPIVVFIDRDIESITAFWGIICSNNFYVPIDKKLPVNRIKAMLQKVEPIAILVKETDREWVMGLETMYPVHVLEYLMEGKIEEEKIEQIRRTTIDTDPLYAIFTSGSTGQPKGVLVSHRSVIDMTEQFVQTFPFEERDIFANQAPFDFDVSVKDIFISMRLGAQLHVVSQMLFAQPKKLIAFLMERRITTVIWAASAVSLIQTYRLFEHNQPETLTKVMFSGEVLPMKALNYWKNYLPNAMYVNLYGPTEITCNCTYYIVEEEFREEEVLPIGRPFKNTEILLLDETDHLIPAIQKDIVGEICVRGTSLALGYYKEMERTKQVFCLNPLNQDYEELIYRTGDLGKYNEKGELLFVSRADSQIKHMGHRIELGEIESAMNAIGCVEKSCCLYDEKQKKIVLIYQAKENFDRQIMTELLTYIPKYMCPNRYVQMEAIPMNSHAKIDRAYLKENLDAI